MGHFTSFIHLKLIFIGRGMARSEPIAMAKQDSMCQLARPRSLPTPGNQMEPNELGERGGRHGL